MDEGKRESQGGRGSDEGLERPRPGPVRKPASEFGHPAGSTTSRGDQGAEGDSGWARAVPQGVPGHPAGGGTPVRRRGLDYATEPHERNPHRTVGSAGGPDDPRDEQVRPNAERLCSETRGRQVRGNQPLFRSDGVDGTARAVAANAAVAEREGRDVRTEP